MIGAIDAKCIGKKNISVEAGNFETYEISYLDIAKIYYSNSIYNIVKFLIEYEKNKVEGELKR